MNPEENSVLKDQDFIDATLQESTVAIPPELEAWLDRNLTGTPGDADFEMDAETRSRLVEGNQARKQMITAAVAQRDFEAAVSHCPDAVRWFMLEHCFFEFGVNRETIAAFLYLWEHGSWLPHTTHDRDSMDEVFDQLLNSEVVEQQPQLLFTPEDWAAFQALPNTFMVYRGYRGEHAAGRSWTMDRATAEFFAVRAGLHSTLPTTVMSMRISKRWVLFYSNGRNEQEIVFDRPMASKCKRVLTPKEIQKFYDRGNYSKRTSAGNKE